MLFQFILDGMFQQNIAITDDSQRTIQPASFRFRNPKNKKYMLHKMMTKQDKLLLHDLKKKSKKKDPQYFSKMLKQQRKKMFVNTFIKKLKNSITLREPPTNYEFSSQKNEKQYLQSFEIPKKMEIFISLFLFVQIIPLLIVNSLAIVLPQIASSDFIIGYKFFSLVIHILEMIIKFLVKHQYQQKKKKYLRQNILSYLYSEDFIIDVIALLSFIFCPVINLNVDDSQFLTNICQLGILLKIKTLLMILAYIQLELIQNEYRQEIWNLIKVFLFNFVIAHCLAIFLLAMSKANHQKNWIIAKKLQNSSWQQLYIWSYYWATTIMLTVGFGDICPTNQIQALCMIFIETTSCIVLAYNINRVGSIISKIRSYDLEKNSNLKVFSQISQKAEINTQIEDKITNYIKQSSVIKRNYNIQQQKNFFSKLPASFKDELLKQMNKKIWTGMTFFQNLSQKTLLQLSKKLQKKLTHPQQIVYTRGHQIDIMILNNGKFGLAYNNGNARSNGTIMQTIQAQSNQFKIASLDFLFQSSINYDIKCVDYMILYKVSLGFFLSILQNSSYDYEYFFTIKDKDKFLLNQFQTQKCKVCQNQRHSIFKCPRVHYIPLKQHVIDVNKKQMKKKHLDILKSVLLRRQKWTDIDSLKNRNKIKQQLMKKRLQITANQSQSFNSFQTNFYRDTQTNIQDLKMSGNSRQLQEQFMLSQQRTYFQVAVDKIKQDFQNNIKQNSGQYKNTVWDLQCDMAHNYKFYFKQFNSQQLNKKPIKKKSKYSLS